MPSSPALSWPAATDFAALADAGWPAIERVPIGGWVARFAGGVTKRANSVYPADSVEDVDAAVAGAERAYRDRGLVPLFQLSDGDAAIAAALSVRGYIERDETLVLAAPTRGILEAVSSEPTGGTAVEVAAEPDDEWLATWWAVDGRGGAAELEVARRIMTGGPALYAAARDDHGTASVARLALVDDGELQWGGLYAVATRRDARGRGHARSVVTALTTLAAARGVDALWLQVLAGNHVARRMYDGLGFRAVATYTYVQAPA